jgi:hypothetical protein
LAVSLLTGTITLHDVDDLEAHLRTDLDVQLKARGGFLTGYEYEDALSYFIGKGWELSLVFDPGRGWSFSKFLRYKSEYFYTDWLRQRHGDARYGQNIIPDELRDEDRPNLDGFTPDVIQMINTAFLSPMARWTHVEIAIPKFVHKETFVRIATGTVISQYEARRRLRAWEEELKAKKDLLMKNLLKEAA